MPTTKLLAMPYTDRLEISEVYSDHIRLATFDGNSVRIEFAVVRPAIAEQNQVGPTVVPVARLVLSPPAAIALLSRLGLLITALESAEGVKRAAPPTSTRQ